MLQRLALKFFQSVGAVPLPKLVLPHWVDKSEEKGSCRAEDWDKHPGSLDYRCAYYTRYSEGNFWVSGLAMYVTMDKAYSISIHRNYDNDKHYIQVCKNGHGSAFYKDLYDLEDPSVPEGILLIVRDMIADIPHLWRTRYDKYIAKDASLKSEIEQHFSVKKEAV